MAESSNPAPARKQRKITIWTKLGYGFGNFIGGGALSISSAWLLFFYTTFCDLPVWEGTLIFTIGTYLDVIENPLMGFITDNFNNTRLGRKFGRRRFWILLTVPLMFWYPLLWQTGKPFAYYLVTYLVYEGLEFLVLESISIPKVLGPF